MNLTTYIEQNRCSIANYGEMDRAGKGIASTSTEVSVNNLVARRMVKKNSRCVGLKKAQTCAFRFALQLPTATSKNVSPTNPRHSRSYLSFLTLYQCRTSSPRRDPR
jgi:hypothetical protein